MSEINSKPDVLIIDDVTSNLLVLAEIIREAGYTPRPVSSVGVADRTIAVKLPDIILLDATMPDKDGFQYCRELKQNVKTRDIPVIFISALNSPKDRVRGFECGAVDFISKPFEKAEVLVRVNSHLKLRQIQRETELHNKKLFRMVSQQFYKIAEERKNIVFALAKLSNAREDKEGEAIAHIAKNCRLLSMALQFTRKYEKVITPEFVETIELASQLHDIGKIAMGDRLLLKEGQLSAEEKLEVSKHATIGAETLREIYAKNESNEFLQMAIDIAENHHEKWDGTGYPHGKSGTQIPLSARIVSVIDAYEMLVAEKSFKKPISPEAAVGLIKEESGKSFDPDIVNIFAKIYTHMEYTQVECEPTACACRGYIDDPRR